MITTEGFNYLLNAGVKEASQYGAWYCFPFEGNYTPTAADVAATFPGLATETTAYEGTTRKAVTFGLVAGGSVDNSAVLAEFTFTADKTIYGAAVMSTPAKGAAAGVLLAVVAPGLAPGWRIIVAAVAAAAVGATFFPAERP